MRMSQGTFEVREDVAFIGKVLKGTDCTQQPQVLGPGSLEKHGYAPTFEFRHDLPESLGPRSVQDL